MVYHRRNRFSSIFEINTIRIFKSVILLYILINPNFAEAKSDIPITVSECYLGLQTRNYPSAKELCLAQLHIAKQQNDVTAMARLQLSLAKIEQKLGNDTQADQYFEQVKTSKAFLSNVLVQYSWFRSVGQKLYSQHEYKKAREYLNQGLIVAQKENKPSWLSSSYNDMGLVNFQLHDFRLAIGYYKQSLDLKLEQKNQYAIGKTYYNIGILYFRLEEYPQSINNYERALYRYQLHSKSKPDDKRILISQSRVYENLAEAYHANNEPEKSNYYSQMLTTNAEFGSSPAEQAHLLAYLADKDVNEGKLLSAKLFIEQATKIQDKAQLPLSADTLSAQAKLYHAQGETHLAIDVLTQALSQFEQLEVSGRYNDFYLLLSQFLKPTNTLKALEFYELYQNNRENLLDKKYQSELKNAQYQLEIQQVERELIQQKLINVDQIARNRQLLNYALILLYIMLITAGLVVFYSLKKRREKQAFIQQIQFHEQQLMLLKTGQVYSNTAEESNTRQAFNKLLVSTMLDALEIWEKHTGLGRIDLSEKSGIWTISIDNGNLRTRSLDKYLSIDKIPKKPRWRNVVRTCHFILSDESLKPSDRHTLDKRLNDIISSVKAQSLNEHVVIS